VVVVLADLRRGDRGYAVVIPEMGEQTLTNGLVKHSCFELFKVGKRLGVAPTRSLGVAADNLLEAAVFGHNKPPQ
jgi:hypothetical protein